jgi:hypothetical protein
LPAAAVIPAANSANPRRRTPPNSVISQGYLYVWRPHKIEAEGAAAAVAAAARCAQYLVSEGMFNNFSVLFGTSSVLLFGRVSLLFGKNNWNNWSYPGLPPTPPKSFRLVAFSRS